MQKSFFILISLFLVSHFEAQEICTPSKRFNKINWNGNGLAFSKPKLWKKTIVPLSLAGLSLSLNTIETKTKLQEDFRKPFNGYKTNVDDYIQYAPIGIMYAADLLKYKSRNSVWNQTKYLAISEVISSGIVQILKYSLKIQRPENGAFNSFPSGHTTQAFVASQVLYNEFNQSNKVLAYSGFLFSIPTGTLRVVNNRHWIPDVLMGAGIGILVTNLVYHFEPLKNWNPWKKKELNVSFIPSLGSDFYGGHLQIVF